MFDSPWYVGSGIAFLILLASVLPERFKPWVALLSAMAAVLCFAIGFERRGLTNEIPHIEVGTFGGPIENFRFDDAARQVCVIIPFANSGAEAPSVRIRTDLKIGETIYRNIPNDSSVTMMKDRFYPYAVCPKNSAAYDDIKERKEVLIDAAALTQLSRSICRSKLGRRITA